MATDVLDSLRLIQEDCHNDAKARIEFTPLGIGTMHGQLLAMIDAIARALAEHLEEAKLT